ncbi:MAG: hypothetical protein P0Y49_04745 [Candidatus Pedobacter colombiensis]|uniref:Uncharacterized protein n=1 Tax=Candidatus Pedobacter colombiensis TaxID=3121371 RepID=A0AAJ6B7M4_9SPHI|nr:hypothetical protein [Pedobacter sp.]WEK20445.1 MAG: hypothetical protein P0Y49_04745 [Pedobacter sp.]
MDYLKVNLAIKVIESELAKLKSMLDKEIPVIRNAKQEQLKRVTEVVSKQRIRDRAAAIKKFSKRLLAVSVRLEELGISTHQG